MSLNDNMKNHEKHLSTYAAKDGDAIYFKEENSDDFRTSYFHDIDRILYSLSYTRYIDKTQVFSFNDNDHICKRIIHVQFVSKIARTIGRALALNEDLIEAAALGHDLGHVPFGHVGEHILNKISLANNEGYFNHNIQSVRTLMALENNGKGKNISVQVLDAIMCHNGEVAMDTYAPCEKTKEQFIENYRNSYNNCEDLAPMTLEGCVVRISDLIAYIGKDIEDAIRLNIISENDIPKHIREVLGSKNKDIINTIIKDVIKNSTNKPYIKLSPEVYNAINDLKAFNYEFIYNKANSKEDIKRYENMFNLLFDSYIHALEIDDKTSSIYTAYLIEMSEDYLKNSKARIVIDYIAGMTDDYFLKEYKDLINQRDFSRWCISEI